MLIYLIGFMGSGKSSIGKELSRRLDYEFIDLDDKIEQEEMMTIAELFHKRGENEFRRLEYKYLRGISLIEHAVISTGGGTPCFFNNMHYMNQNGMTIFLDVDVRSLTNRLIKEKKKRPLISRFEYDQLMEYLEIKLTERIYHYKKAYAYVDASKSIDDVVRHILMAIDSFPKQDDLRHF